MQRREGFGICGIRITKKPDYQQVLAKGELRSELAYLLNFLSSPKANDTYLDPFCGNGSLPISIAKNFSYKQIIALDIDDSRIKDKFNKSKLNYNNFSIVKRDFFDYDFGNLKFNKIITDPPWGEEQKVGDLGEFYTKLLNKCKEILVKDGIMILLVANKGTFIKVLEKFAKDFKLDKELRTFIGGREVWVVKLIPS
jgi:tRNA G10  N-methylase Trm11